MLGEQLQRLRRRQRVHGVLDLTLDVQRPTRGRHQRHAACRLEQLAHHVIGVGDLFQVVQYEQDPLVRDVGEEPRRGLAIGRGVHRLGDRRPHATGLSHAGQVHHEHAIRKQVSSLCGQCRRQPGLARTTRTGQRQ
jgi:hypothetical protein